MLGHKISLNKFKSFKIIWSMLSDHNGMILKINNRNYLGYNSQIIEADQVSINRWTDKDVVSV